MAKVSELAMQQAEAVALRQEVSEKVFGIGNCDLVNVPNLHNHAFIRKHYWNELESDWRGENHLQKN